MPPAFRQTRDFRGGWAAEAKPPLFLNGYGKPEAFRTGGGKAAKPTDCQATTS